MSKRCGVTTILRSTFNLGDGINSGGDISMGNGPSGSNQDNNSSRGRVRSGGIGYQRTERRVLPPQEIMNIRAGHGLIWLPGMGTRTIPFFAPNYWDCTAPWVTRVKPNPYQQGQEIACPVP